jgi:hypothetical protein
MSDSRLSKLGEWFDRTVDAEMNVPEDEDIPENIDVLGIAHRISKIKATSRAGLNVKARAIDYMLEYAPEQVAWMAESLLTDLRRLGVLPPSTDQSMPGDGHHRRVVRLVHPGPELRLAA